MYIKHSDIAYNKDTYSDWKTITKYGDLNLQLLKHLSSTK